MQSIFSFYFTRSLCFIKNRTFPKKINFFIFSFNLLVNLHICKIFFILQVYLVFLKTKLFDKILFFLNFLKYFIAVHHFIYIFAKCSSIIQIFYNFSQIIHIFMQTRFCDRISIFLLIFCF